MKTFGIIAVSAISGAVAACILMRWCSKKKGGPCACGGKCGGCATTKPASTQVSAPPVADISTQAGANSVQQAVQTGTTEGAIAADGRPGWPTNAPKW